METRYRTSIIREEVWAVINLSILLVTFFFLDSAGISVTQILKGIQELLDDPNTKSPANIAAYMMYDNDRAMYDKRIKLQAIKHAKS